MEAFKLSLAMWAALCAMASTATPSVHIGPALQVLEGEPVHITVTGAAPGSQVVLTAERWLVGRQPATSPPRLMQSEAVFVADQEGRVDLRTASSVAGSYLGIDPRGLFWSMLRSADAKPAVGAAIDPAEVRIRMRNAGAQDEARVRLMPALPVVEVRHAVGLPGALFAALPGPKRRPALIVLGGSEGGSSINEAAAPFASHGFAVLALPVFSPPDRTGHREIPQLPAAWADLPVETLNAARDWLMRQPDVDATRIALHGTSMGALLALLAAVHLPWVTGVVASVPSDVVWDGWGLDVEPGKRSTFSVGGKPLPFVPLVGYEEELRGYANNEPVILRRAFERGRAARPDLAAHARVPVERIRGAVMIIGAYDDQMWPSGQMAQNIVEKRLEAGLPTDALIYQDAGHLLYGTGYAPTTGYNAGLRKTGGTPQANARAQAEVWPQTLRFLKRVLGLGQQ